MEENFKKVFLKDYDETRKDLSVLYLDIEKVIEDYDKLENELEKYKRELDLYKKLFTRACKDLNQFKYKSDWKTYVEYEVLNGKK